MYWCLFLQKNQGFFAKNVEKVRVRFGFVLVRFEVQGWKFGSVRVRYLEDRFESSSKKSCSDPHLFLSLSFCFVLDQARLTTKLSLSLWKKRGKKGKSFFLHWSNLASLLLRGKEGELCWSSRTESGQGFDIFLSKWHCLNRHSLFDIL